MTERTTVAFRNLNVLHRLKDPSDANDFALELSCCVPGRQARDVLRTRIAAGTADESAMRAIHPMHSTLRHVLAAERARTDARSQVGIAGVVVALIALKAAGLAAKRASRRRATLVSVAVGAAAGERRRVARDLHDGIAQDLALIAAYSEQITAAMGPGHPVVTAARRALAISRSTIDELSDPPGATPPEMLGALGRELADRFGISIDIDAPYDLELAPAARHHLTRILREAVSNAVRHGGAKNVAVTLTQARDKVGLRVADDGRSAHQEDSRTEVEGFGKRSMRERALALGGELRFRRSPVGGTELEVVMP
jgi:signal transduction histidine kinase